MTCAAIVLPLALHDKLTYLVPASVEPRIAVGMWVVVPLGKKKFYGGVVAELSDTPPQGDFQLRAIAALIADSAEKPDGIPCLSLVQLQLWQWLANYYMCTLGEVMRAALPATLKVEAETPEAVVARLTARPRRTRPQLTLPDYDPDYAARPLSEEQERAVGEIKQVFAAKDVCLLHGITSSGKTEVYMRLIREAIEAGGQVLYLVPEIALTTQLTNRLGRTFGSLLAVYHSRLSDAARAGRWLQQQSEEACPIVLGARSALFLPFDRLRLVIVDEEHDGSYKQQDPAPRYNGRDTAIMLAKLHGANVLLGTATPSVETYFHATCDEKYGYTTLTRRFGQATLPKIYVEDIADLQRRKEMTSPFAPQLVDLITEALNSDGQAILFQNRRGYSPVVQCTNCGWTAKCTRCDVTLTLHRTGSHLSCHYCGNTFALPERCPECGGERLRDVGFGTERIEEAVSKLFPNVPTARLDLDATRTRSAYEQILNDFSTGKTRLLIGTQMVTKGLDFDRVRVVGVLCADQMLSRPDFRATERAFQLMCQVAGRAGRRKEQGAVVIQTRRADTPVLQQVMTGDYDAFFENELCERAAFCFPPYCRLIDVYIRHRKEAMVNEAALSLAAMLRPVFGEALLGPETPAVGRIGGWFVRKMVVKLTGAIPLRQAKAFLLTEAGRLLARKGCSALRIHFDVDP